MSAHWYWMSAADLGRGVNDGSINPVELTEAFLHEIERHHHAPLIYARTTPRRARSMAMAAAARAKAGLRIGPLDGVPVSWKDLVDAAGAGCEAGSALLKGRVPDTDAEVLVYDALARPGVWVARRVDIARHWVASHPPAGAGAGATAA